jgi:PST family polysaccharide transporter
VIIIALSSVASLAVSVLYPQHKTLCLVIVIMGFGRALSPVAALYSAHMEKELDYRSIAIVKTGASAFSTLGSLIMAAIGLGVWGLVAREFIMSLLTLIGNRHVSIWRFGGRFDTAAARKLIDFSNKMLLSKGLETALLRLDYLIVGLIGGVVTLGYYSQARYLVDVVNAASSPIAIVAFPAYARMNDRVERLARGWRLHLDLLVWLTVPFCLAFAIFPSELVSLVFGQRWRPAAEALMWLAPYALLMPVLVALRALLYGLGRIAADIKIQMVQALFGVIAISVGMFGFGLPGAAVGAVLAVIAGIAAGYAASWRYTRAGVFTRLAPAGLAAIVSTAIGLVLKISCQSMGNKWIDIARIAAVTVSYPAALFLVWRDSMAEILGLVKISISGTANDKVDVA